jgi:hypothetical protein
MFPIAGSYRHVPSTHASTDPVEAVLGESCLSIELVMRRGESSFHRWTEKLELLSLHNNDLPETVGFVESDIDDMLPRSTKKSAVLSLTAGSMPRCVPFYSSIEHQVSSEKSAVAHPQSAGIRPFVREKLASNGQRIDRIGMWFVGVERSACPAGVVKPCVPAILH